MKLREPSRRDVAVFGLLWLIFVALGYVMMVVPGLILHLICILSAASGKKSARSPSVSRERTTVSAICC